MREWKKVKLKEVLTEITERNKEEKVKNVLSVTNSQGFISQEEYFEGTVHSQDISNYKIIRKNQFAYNPSRVNVGSIDILKTYDEGALSPMYVVFKADDKRLLPEYFKYYFQTHRFEENVRNNTQGSVRNSLSFKMLSEFEYILPSIEEQEEIVKILEKVDLITNKYKILLKEKNQFIKSQFVEMFKECKKTKLSDIANIVMGQSPNSNSYNDNEDGIPFFQGKADYGDKYTIVRHWTNSPSKLATKGDVLMSVRAPVGPVNISSCNCCIGRGLCSISAKNGITNNEYLYNYENYDLVKEVKKIIKRYEVMEYLENYNFILEMPKKVIVNADKDKINQVIYNLLNNAINYTGKDKVVKIKITKEEKDYLVEVVDTGKGIKKEELPYIWDKYYKNEKNHQRNIVSTGLGLSIVKEILSKHNFEYGVNTQINKGSTFYFKIPL